MMLLVVLLSFLGVLFDVAVCFNTGAGRSACVTMQPGHYGTYPMETLSGYVVRVSETMYVPGGILQVSIERREEDVPPFKGFLLRAQRLSGNTTEHIGTFITEENKKIHTKCQDTFGNVVTHSSDELKNSVTVMWKAPPESQGPIVFLATVVQMYYKYWMRIPSDILLSESSRAAPQVTDMSANISTERTAKESMTTTMAQRPFGEDNTISSTERPLREDGTTTVAQRSFGEGATTTTPEMPVGEDGTTTMRQRPFGEGFTPTTPERSVGEDGTTTMRQRPFGEDKKTSSAEGTHREDIANSTTQQPSPHITDTHHPESSPSETPKKTPVDKNPNDSNEQKDNSLERLIKVADPNEQNRNKQKEPNKSTKNQEHTAVEIGTGECGITKGCCRYPRNCREARCSLLVTWQDLGDAVIIELSADSNGWIALGFSHDSLMGNDSVTECAFARKEGKIHIRNSYNGQKNNTVLPQAFQSGISGKQGSVTESDSKKRIRCRFIRNKADNGQQVFDLNQSYHLLLARGSTKQDGTKLPHLLNPADRPKVSPEKINLSQITNCVLGSGENEINDF